LANLGGLQVAPEQHHLIDEMDVTTGWSALSNDTLNLATTTKHVLGTAALTFDKVDGADNTVFAAIEKTITSVDLGNPSPHDVIQTACYIPDLTDVSYVFIRLGTDSSNYNEWRIEDTALTAATYETLLFNIGDASYAGITGNGWDPSAVTYVAIGVAFDAETNTLAGIVFDEISFHTNLHTSAELNAEVSSSVSSAKVDLQKINGSVVDKGSGNSSNGSQRIAVATDDVNLSAIKTSTEIMDDWDNAASDGASVSGDVAHDSADAGEPVKIGGKARTANPTAVANNDRVDAFFDDVGRQVMTLGVPRDLIVAPTITTISNTNETTVLSAIASTFLDVVGVIITNTSTTSTEVTFKDSTGGTSRFKISAPANDTRGITLPYIVPQATANNNWTATAADSVSSLDITVFAIKNV
jgi:hypothetical protein